MSFSRIAILFSVVLGSAVACIDKAEACPPRGGYSRSYSYSRYSRPSYSYSRPSHIVRPVQPIVQQPLQPVAPQQLQQAPPAGQLSPGQGVPQQSLQGQQAIPQASVAPSQPPTPPQQPLRTVGQSSLAAPGQAPQAAPTTAPVAPAPVPQSAQMSALQALGGFAPPAAATAPATTAPAPPAPQVQLPAHVGEWNASLGNGATVRLTLNADNSFSWTATNKAGSTSTFSGAFSVSEGSLTLNRANDQQALVGSMTMENGNAFSFKVGGNNAAAISFTRGR